MDALYDLGTGDIQRFRKLAELKPAFLEHCTGGSVEYYEIAFQ
jgi:hypothetical protein